MMMRQWRGCMPASPARICPASRNSHKEARGQPMPRFAANLTMMFNEVPFLDRFDAAARAGFTAVEFLFPYDHPAEEVGKRLKAAGLTQALFNLPAGTWEAGGKGFVALTEIMPIIGHVQIASIPSRNEPDGEELNYPFLFDELDRLGYGGFVGCEYNPRGKTTDGLGWFKSYAGAKP